MDLRTVPGAAVTNFQAANAASACWSRLDASTAWVRKRSVVNARLGPSETAGTTGPKLSKVWIHL